MFSLEIRNNVVLFRKTLEAYLNKDEREHDLHSRERWEKNFEMTCDANQRAVCETRDDSHALEELEPHADSTVPECHYMSNPTRS